MTLKCKSNAGVTLALAVVASVVLGVTFVYMVKLINLSAHQSTFYDTTDQTFKLAETGLNLAVAYFATSTDLNHFNTLNLTETRVDDQDGWYQNQAFLRTRPRNPIYYLISTGHTRVNGKDQYVQLHSYVRVSNVGEYFAVVKTKLEITRGRDISAGKIYAPNLVFDSAGSGNTMVGDAEYMNSVSPAVNIGNPNDPSDDVWVSNPGFIQIAGSTTKPPTYNPNGVIFPEVSGTDLDYWKTTAGPHVVANNFYGDIYPPGFIEFDSAHPKPNDSYVNHSNNNYDHVYYSDTDIHIRGRVHGQVLFVSKGDIYITGDLVKADEPGESSIDISLPGGSSPGASKAHQAVLITQGTVYVSNQAFIGVSPAGPYPNETQITDVPTSVVYQKIRALVMAPNASLIPLCYASDNYHNMLALDFQGSMVLSEVSSNPPNNFPSVFHAGSPPGSLSRYSYDVSLRDNPPPYLPAITEIYYVFEKSGSSKGLYGS